MDNETKSVYSVEYEMAEVVFYKKVIATSFDNAKSQIRQQYPDVHIRAVSILDDLTDV
ncbi:hypothetical protein IE3_02314 [Bacillus cereus BAG3X2-1]|uniref:hypothetical protein n=1 Tax=Bacillus nitratireducens TaxID=2026193 RepID=UPI000279314A|nr:hypothetical protein [Bacillus nitratireducens]EJQ13415.1 hypothetical protein IE3_02314 [Bacillus cereus BAG3X2-1]